MAYLTLPLCADTHASTDYKTQMLHSSDKAALTTDVALAALMISVGVLALLQVNGVVNLSHFSSLGAIGSQAASIMIGIGGGVIVLDIAKLIFQQARHIKRLHNPPIDPINLQKDAHIAELERENRRLSVNLEAETEAKERATEKRVAENAKLKETIDHLRNSLTSPKQAKQLRTIKKKRTASSANSLEVVVHRLQAALTKLVESSLGWKIGESSFDLEYLNLKHLTKEQLNTMSQRFQEVMGKEATGEVIVQYVTGARERLSANIQELYDEEGNLSLNLMEPNKEILSKVVSRAYKRILES